MNDHIQTLSALFGNEPFFRGNTFGIQGFPPRHAYMMAAIKRVARTGKSIRLLEIGSWTGSSVYSFSQAISTFSNQGGEILCVDPWMWGGDNPQMEVKNDSDRVAWAMWQLVKDHVAYNLYLHNTRIIPNKYPRITIEHKRGRSIDVLPNLPRSSFDMIYIDGNHYYDDAIFDIRNSDLLLKDGGILCGDDLEAQSSEVDMDTVRANMCVDYIQCPKTGRFFHPGVTLAVHEAFGRHVSAYAGFWIVAKSGSNYVDVSLDDLSGCIPNHFNAEEKRLCEDVINSNLKTPIFSKAG